MALIGCPDCGKDVSDEARSCPYCGCPVAAKMGQLRAQQEAEALRLQQEEEARRLEKQKEVSVGILCVVGFALVVLVMSCMSQASLLLNLTNQTTNFTSQSSQAFDPLGSAKIKIEYSCISSASTKGVQSNAKFTLVNLDTNKSVWSKFIQCPASKIETIQISEATYRVSVSVKNAIWDMKITKV